MSQYRGKMSQCRGKMSQCWGKLSQFLTTCPEQGVHTEMQISQTHVLVIKMAFYILNITSFNSMLCQKDAEASQISYEVDYFC